MMLFSAFNNLRKYTVALILLLVGVFSLGYVVLSLSSQARLPSDGVLLTEFMAAGLRVATDLDPQEGALAVGDEIVSIDGLTVWEWGEHAWQEPSGPGWQVGQTVVYEVNREQTKLAIPVTLRAFPVGRLPLTRFGVYSMVITVLIVGCYMLLRYPEEAVSRLIFVIALCLTVLLLLHFQVMTLVVPALFIFESVLKFLARAFLFSAIFHFLLVFPINKIPAPTITKHLPLFHLVNPAFSLLCGLVFEDTPLRSWLLASQVSAWLGLAMLAAGVVSIVHTALTVRKPAVVGQIRWIAWGAAISILPYLFLTGLPELLWGQAFLTIEITAFFLIAMPLSVAIAVARYRLFDIDTLVLQVFVHILFALVLLGGYFLLKSALHGLGMLLFGEINATNVTFAAAFFVTSVFWVFRARVLAYARQLIYRDVLDAPKLLQQMTGKLTSALRLDQLTTLLTHDLPEQMRAGQGVLMVLNEDGASLVSSAGESIPPSPLALPLRSGISVWLAHGGAPLVYSAPPDWAPPDLLDFMARRDIELAVLLQVGERVVGLWGLGPRKGRLSYTTADVRLIVTLASQAALAVENVQLVQRMQADQRNLEEEVERHSRAMVNDRNRLSAILQNMADALLVTDLSGRIQLANPAFERLVRQASRSFWGQDVAEVLPLPKLSEVMAQAGANPGMVHTVDITMIAPRLSGANNVALTEHILRVSATALGDGSAVIFILRDITHEVEVDRMKSEFVSAVSHELRTPLTSIVGFAKLITRAFERSIKSVLPVNDGEIEHVVEQIDHNLEIMIAEGEHLTTIINDVLDISALDAGTLVWNDAPCDLRALAQDIVAESRALTDEKGLALITDFETESLPLHADCERLRQVLGNLISNAIKFTEYGKITVSLKRLPPGTLHHGWDVPETGAALAAVKDTGLGITEEGLPHIFQRFHQVGDAYHGKPKGTGLGLAICYEIITHYGGEIWVESTVGQGSTFYFTLPLSEQDGG
ncbi:MAG: ATP-binding protein [Anaerolineae bacterium]